LTPPAINYLIWTVLPLKEAIGPFQPSSNSLEGRSVSVLV
jgi:hypothetical protein